MKPPMIRSMTPEAIESGRGLAAVQLPLDRSTTAERVGDGLRDLILRGELLPGEPLREAAVATAFGVSRNTAREAFRLLARERLTAHEMHRGVVVKVLSAADVADIFATRRALELPALAGRDAVPPATAAGLAAAVDEGEAGVRARDWGGVATANLRFHGRLVELLGSRRIDELFRVTLAELRLGFALAGDQAALLAPFVPRNRAILERIAAAELDAAVAALGAYLDDSEAALSAAVA